MKSIIFILALGFSMKAFSFNKEADTTTNPINKQLLCIENINDCFVSETIEKKKDCQTSDADKKPDTSTEPSFYKDYFFAPCVSKRVLL
jgi:hypothetical protein